MEGVLEGEESAGDCSAEEGVVSAEDDGGKVGKICVGGRRTMDEEMSGVAGGEERRMVYGKDDSSKTTFHAM